MDWPGPDYVPTPEPITEPGGKESADCLKLGPLGTLEKWNGSCWGGLRMGLTPESCSVPEKRGQERYAWHFKTAWSLKDSVV